MSVKGYLGSDGAHLIGASKVIGADGKIIADSAGSPNELVRKNALGDQVSGPVTMDAFGEIFGATIDAANNTIIDNRLSMANVLTVKQNPGDGEYSSVAAALAAVVSPSPTNPWVIEIGPGIYTEPQLTLVNGVHLKGFETASAILQPSVTTTAFILGASGASISRLTVRGANGVGGVGVSYTNGAAARFDITDANLQDCTTLVSVSSTSVGTPCITTVRNCTLTAPFTTGVLVTTAGGATNTLVNGLLYFNPTGSAATSVLKATGANGTLLVTDSFTIQVGGNGIHIADGARLFAQSFAAASCARGIWVENTGAAPAANIQGFVGRNNTADLVVDHPTATGSALGAFVVANCSVASSLFAFFSSDPTGGIAFTGDVTFGPSFAQKTLYTQLFIQSPAMGPLNGGGLSSGGGTTVNVGAGYGYYETGGAIVYKTWNNTSITVGAAVDEYIYFDSTGTLVSNATFPDTSSNIILGRVVTRGSVALVISPVAQLARHTANKLATTLRRGLGSVVASGMVVSENVTPLHLNISSGEYYVGVSNYVPTAQANFSFSTFRSNGSGDWTIATGVTAIPNTQYDGGAGSLVTMTNNRWAKHALYTFGDASTGQSYFLVYAQAEYTSQASAETAPLPNPPSFLRESIVPVAGIVFQKSTASIAANGSILDIRPRVAGTSTSGTAVADHGSLSGLFPDDDHGQYLNIQTANVAGNVTLTNRTTHLVSTAAARTLTLPAPSTYFQLTVKDSTGNAATNNITINPAGAQTIDGAASYVVDANYGAVTIVSDGTNYFTDRTKNPKFTTATLTTGLVGRTSGVVVSATYVGELITSTRVRSAALGITTATATNVTASALPITAGEWELYGFVAFETSGGVTTTSGVASLSATSATHPGLDTIAVADSSGQIRNQFDGNLGASAIRVIDLGPTRVTLLAASTNYFLVATLNFSGGTATVFGSIRARRIA